MSNNTKKILIIEDNASDADLVMEILDESENYFLSSHLSFKTTWSKCLKEAKQNFAKQNFDVILCDLNLEDSKGLQTLEEIKRLSPDSSIIILTGYINRQLWSEAIKKGADDYLTKNNLDGNVLVRSICYALERAKFKRNAIAV